MLKSVIVATAALAIAGTSLVYAQQRFGHQGFGGPGAEQRHRPSAADMAAFTDARVAALKAGLELTPDQAKNWPAFEQAVRDAAQLRIQRMQEREAHAQQGQNAQGNPPGNPQGNAQAQTQRNPFERMARRADRMAKSSAALKKVADAGAPLYQSLTDDQKARFRTLGRMLAPHHRRMAFNEGNDGWRGRGFGRDGQGFGRDGQGFGHHRFGPNGGENDGGPGKQL
jgi:LTXXQ motif family protein